MLLVRNLFELLCLGLETKTVSEVQPESFCEMSQEDWRRIREMADKQGVSAIMMDGLSLLVDKYGKEGIAPNIDSGWWQMYVLEGMGAMLQTEKRNSHQLKVMESLASKWMEKGCRVMVFKGQASATMYPKPEHRSPGDIDCYLINDNDNDNVLETAVAEQATKGRARSATTGDACQSKNENANANLNFSAYHRGNGIARKVGADVDEGWYKHSQIHYKGEMFESHQYFVHTRDGKRGKLQQKELEDYFKRESVVFSELSYSVLLPPVQWTAMFLTYHACAHFVSEGLRLKQLLDWAMLLEKHQNDVDWKQFYDFCERCHLKRFADAATSICVKYLNVNVLCKQSEQARANHNDNDRSATTGDACQSKNLKGWYKESPYAEKILDSALYDDDYVFGSGEGSWHNRWHLVKTLFRYRWKYEEIYEESVWRQLWFYASGYLFHTE